ncbi:TPA: hypothetical protein HA239_03895 [Candidatus Woesearchaeota archaeon]|nr:hypothetical protein QT06_C0001G0803 [archaeon GW2011_AR15]MBS3103417.1 hypothetical protein [Candidatus Woesearchaeota archaeon]HIH41534.1 hypothetical protein [Candidatus Woesearchaeota archaeon]
MIIFGINVPLPEILALLIIMFAVFLYIILRNIQRVSTMSLQSRNELMELARMTEEEREEIDKISGYEKETAENISKFEKEILNLEQETDTLYIQKLAPDLYKIQNYTLWALKKGLSPEQIRQNLKNKGWKDNEIIQMIINDTLKYTSYYQTRKGKVEIPSIKIEETTRIIKPVKIVNVRDSAKKEEVKKAVPKPQPVKKEIAVRKEPAEKTTKAQKKPSRKKSKDSLGDVEKKLKRLEKDMSSEKKK